MRGLPFVVWHQWPSRGQQLAFRLVASLHVLVIAFAAGALLGFVPASLWLHLPGGYAAAIGISLTLVAGFFLVRWVFRGGCEINAYEDKHDSTVEATSPRILIADLDWELSTCIEAALMSLGYRVTKATEMVAARQEIESYRPDLILLELLLPEETGGWAVIDAVKERTGPPPKLVVFTAMDDRQSRERAFRSGVVVSFIRKPAKLCVLLRVISGLCPVQVVA